MNEFTFNTELFGLDVEVTAEVTQGERQTHQEPGFDTYVEITSVTHQGEEMELDGAAIRQPTAFSNVFISIYDDLEQQALKKLVEEAKDSADERAAEARDY